MFTLPIAYNCSMIYTVITTKENTKHRKEVINMLTNRETNAAIKRELKAAGYNTKSFKVSVKDCGYSTSAHVTIKDPTVNRHDIKRLLLHWQEIDRDERTGEILAGDNLYLRVDYDYGIYSEVAAEYLANV